MGENAGRWKVYDAVNYSGNAGLVLMPGQEYADPDEMGLVLTVKSIRKLVDNQPL